MKLISVLKTVWENGKAIKIHDYHAKFLQFGNDYEMHDNGIGNFTVAIIQLDDGTVHKVEADNIQFLS